ncbi:outer membrane protein assembly factor BamB [Undibacterium sp. 14-3-2]|uniref:outer membrane protein assembly factor BamB n=1 Tax=Undibacterium sp. 14-3-2 TaxID=2800129 RepID=UPI001905B9FC|nr:outer membrane protein assembly factor BamB [Undibacterium sp. 14-3-2]MBK1891592.1 outer membrane protein assembly factor BamB [Undibacterium sp. 14-3-2]
MHFSAKIISAAALCVLAGCSSWNPFASKSEKNVPAALLEIKPTLSVKQLWSVQAGSSQNYVFSPAIVGQQLYVAAADGTLLKIDAASGRADWRINAGVRLTGGVGANARTVVVAGDKGGVFAFDNEGKLRWKNQDSTEILSAPALSDSLVVVRSIDNKISAYDVETGARKWVVERTLPALTLRAFPGLVVAGDQVIIALPGGRMAALSLANGSLRWEAVVGEPKGATELERVADVSGFPAIIGRDVCASAYQGRVGCFDLNTGAVRWVKKLSSEVGAGVDERFVFAADVGGAVTAYNRESGSSAWKNDKLANRRLSAPVSFGRSVVVGDLAGYVHFLSREDGSFIGRLPTDGSQILAAPVVVGSNLIVQTKSGLVVAIATE